MSTNTFSNPYETSSPTKRLNTEVSESDYNLIRLIRPDMGTMKNTINLLWHQFCHELRERSITDITEAARFEHFVSNCRIVPADEYEQLLHSATDNARRPVSEANGTNERSRAKRVRATGAKQSSQQPDVSSERGSQSGGNPGEGEKSGNSGRV